MEVSTKLRLKLQERHMTVSELAKKLGYCRQHTSALVNGKRGVSVKSALKLSATFGTSIHFWLNDNVTL